MDDLIQELNELRLTRHEATNAYHRVMEDSNRQERSLLADIQRRQRGQRQNSHSNNTIRNNRRNPIKKDDIVKITNNYRREEYGVVGKVTDVTRRMVYLKNEESGTTYSRAWWNVSHITEGTNPQ